MKLGTSRMSAAPVGRTGTSCATPAPSDFVLVTNNAGDFRRLYAAQPLHAGLVILIPNVRRASQRRLFRGALDAARRHRRAGQPVLEVDLDGDDVTLTLYDWPPPEN